MSKKINTIISLLLIGCSLVSCQKETLDLENVNATSRKSLETGTSTLISNPKNLNVIYFLPVGVAPVADYENRLSELLVNYQAFIKSEMIRNGFGAMTFGLAANPENGKVKFIVIQGQKEQSTYDYGSYSRLGKEIEAYRKLHPEEFSSDHNLIFLAQRTDNGTQPFYGVGRTAYVLDNKNIKVSQLPVTKSNYLAGNLHELGHGLNLAHNAETVGESKTLGTSLMGTGSLTYGRRPTFISLIDATILSVNQIFQPDEKSSYYKWLKVKIEHKGSFNAETNAVEFVGKFTSNSPVKAILCYLDPEGGSDYDAIGRAVQPLADNTFKIAVPLAEFKKKNNEKYEVRMKILSESGSVSQAHLFKSKFRFVKGAVVFE